MAKGGILTPLAESNYDTIIAYLLNKWNAKTAGDFIDRFKEVTGFISKSPAIYSFVDRDRKIQKCVLTKHNTIYFVERENVIIILAIFDSRQDPQKLLL
jgi:plasmid stabilization system protein ParE